MKTTTLLDEIHSMIHGIGSDHTKLELLHKFIREQIYQNDTPTGDALQEALEEDPEIPDRYKPLLKRLVPSLDTGMICYVNPDTLEVVSIPENVTLEYFLGDEQESGNKKEDPFHKDLKRIQREWTGTIVIEPPHEFESFRFMERFVFLVSDKMLQNSLGRALQGHKPFRNFNSAIHDSEWLDRWYAYRRKCLELYAASHFGIREDTESPPGGKER